MKFENFYETLKKTETISRTDEGQPRPKYIFNIMWNITST